MKKRTQPPVAADDVESVRRDVCRILSMQLPAIARELSRQAIAGNVPAAKLAVEIYKTCHRPPCRPRARRS